jgi:Tol biopolymer transport system component
VYLRDARTGGLQLVSATPAGRPGARASGFGLLPVTPGGRFVAFSSDSSDLVAGDTNAAQDVFLRDTRNRTTVLVSVSSSGAQVQGRNDVQALSADGRYVLFTSDATTLVPGDTNGERDVFLRDTQNRTTVRVNLASSGAQADGYTIFATMSADARYVAFQSAATNLVPGDTNGAQDIFVRDVVSGTTERVSVDPAGRQFANGAVHASISANGRYVVFQAYDATGTPRSWLRDRVAGTTTEVDLNSLGQPADAGSGLPFISPDAHVVTFTSGATNLGGPTTLDGLYVRDLRTGTTTLASVNAAGELANQPPFPLAISDRGVVFRSMATNLVPGTPVDFLRAYVRSF